MSDSYNTFRIELLSLPLFGTLVNNLTTPSILFTGILFLQLSGGKQYGERQCEVGKEHVSNHRSLNFMRSTQAFNNGTETTFTLIVFVNLFNPNINMYILLTVLHIFLMLLVGRFCLKIKAFHLW